MLLTAIFLGSLTALATAQTQTWYGQCGGSSYTGPTACATGATCSTQNPYYAQCTPTSVTQSGVATLYGQCGGSGYTGPTSCAPGGFCSTQNSNYAQCTPNSLSTAPSTVPATTTSSSKTTLTTSTIKSTTTTSSTSTKLSSTSSASSSSKSSSVSSSSSKISTTSTTSTSAKTSTTPKSTGLRYAGINIAGCDFGMDTNGNSGTSYCPSSTGPTQMQHFTSADGFNIFRLPVGWQYLVANTLGGTLDPNFFATYDALVKSCLSYGAYCIIDIHNYARWNGAIIGQSGGSVTNAHFTSLWSQLATKYATNSAVIFGLMNEPHDLDMTQWATTVQAAVNAIRSAGATSQLILLPGTDYTGAGQFVQDSAPYLANVKDSDGTTTKLIYDVHRYYDSDGSGTSPQCVQDHISDSFSPLATYLRSNGRQALLTETGGGGTASCEQYVCNALAYLYSNADVYLGYTGWGAGSFSSDPNQYPLTETPINGQDQPLVSMCLAKYL